MNRFMIAGAFAVVMLIFAQTGLAQTNYTWTQQAGGTQRWDVATNWLGGVVPNTVADDTVEARYDPPSGRGATYLDLVADRTLGTFSFNLAGFNGTAQNYFIQSGNTLTLAGSTPTIDSDSKTKLTLNCILAGTNGLRKTGSALLTLNNTSNTFSGGITFAAGTIGAVSDGAFGDPSNDITVSGNATFSLANNISYPRNFVLNNGVTLQFSDQEVRTLSGAFTGQGGIRIGASGFGTQPDITLSSTNNTFEGTTTIGTGDNSVKLTVNSFADSANPLELRNGGKGDGTKFVWGSGAVAPLVLNERQIIISGSDNRNHYIENANTNASNTITIHTDFDIPRTSSRELILNGVNTGDNLIAGVIPDGSNSVTTLKKEQSGTWVLSGKNTYTGPTFVSGGILKLAADETLPDATTLTINGGKLELEAGVRERVDNLVLGSTTQSNLTSYGSSLSSAEIQDDTRFAGSGLLFLGIDPPPQGTMLILR